MKAKAQSQGLSPEQYAEEALSRDLEEVASAADTTPRQHISEVIRQRMTNIPAEVWKDFPSYGASEHDHCIYSLPKRNA